MHLDCVLVWDFPDLKKKKKVYCIGSKFCILSREELEHFQSLKEAQSPKVTNQYSFLIFILNT